MAGGMIVVGGENLVDLIQNEQGNGLSYQAKPGGSPFNCAMAIGRQGSNVGYLTPISTDNLGQLLAETLEGSGVELLAERRSEPTSLAVVSLSDGVPSYQFYRETTAERMVTLDGLTKATPEVVHAFYVGSLALTGGEDADVWAGYYCGVHAKGVFTALDPNIRPAFIHDRDEYIARLSRVLMQTDLLKLSDEDLSWLFPDENVGDAANKLLKRTSAKILVVTLGDEGAFALASGHKISVQSALVVNLRDTVGAGDTFMATLLAYLSRNDVLSCQSLGSMNVDDVKKMLKWAACAAALNCEEDGCSPPTLEELGAACIKNSC
jgi:fructokinase